MTDYDVSNGSDLGGFGHADSIEPGVLDEKAETKRAETDPAESGPAESGPAEIDPADPSLLSDPEGLAGAHDAAADDN